MEREFCIFPVHRKCFVSEARESFLIFVKPGYIHISEYTSAPALICLWKLQKYDFFCVWNEKKTGVKSHHIPGQMCHRISLQLILKFKAVTAVLGLLDRLHCNKWFHTFRSLGEINRKRESICTFFHCWGHKNTGSWGHFPHCMLGGIFGFKRGIRFVFWTPVMLFLRVRKGPPSLYK